MWVWVLYIKKLFFDIWVAKIALSDLLEIDNDLSTLYYI